MKLEKREITLNELDSLQDAFYMEKTLLYEYVQALSTSKCKETRLLLTNLMKEVAEDMLFLQDLLHGTAITNSEA